MMDAIGDMCPYCNRKWYKKIAVRTDGTGKKYYNCKCLICHQNFDMEQCLYNNYDKKMKRLGNEDEDVAELLIKKKKCIYCGGRIEKSNYPEVSKDNASRIVSEILHCRNPKCEKMFYVPKSIYDTIQDTLG